MKLPRRRFLHLAAGAAALPIMPRVARAQAYPTRPVRIIVGFPPAGGADIMARLIGPWLSAPLGQSFVIENRPGAGGNIGTETAVRAPADGYTLLLALTRMRSTRRSIPSSASISSATFRRLPASAAKSCSCCVVAPRNTPADVIETLNREVNTALADPRFEGRLADLGCTALAGSPAEFGKLIADDAAKWGRVIRFANIKLE